MNSYAHHPPQPPSAVPNELEKQRAESRSRLAAVATTVLVHLVLFAALAWIILGPIEPEPPAIEITPATDGTEKPEIKPDVYTHILPPKTTCPSGPAINVIAPITPASVTVPSFESESDLFGSGLGDDFGFGGDGFGPPGGPPGPPGIPPDIKGRCSQSDRARRLRENGGTPALDRQVVAALDWLKGEQNADGSWGQNYPVAMTGFALLAFSGHCETVDSPRYGANLIQAINYLVGKSRANSGLLASKPGSHSSYEHAIASYALAEAFSLNKNARAKVKPISPALRNAVPIIVEGQTAGGGWLYGYGMSGTGDLSISGWNIQALKAAELTGLRFAGLREAKARAIDYLRAAATPDGLYRYRIRDNDRGRLSLTGVGVLCARMLGATVATENKSLTAILAQRPKGFRSADPYALYYHSQACFQKGGSTWKKYNRAQQKLVIDAQEKNGSWPVAAGHIGAAKADAKVYHTCLCTLMLEVYYRYLPATDL